MKVSKITSVRVQDSPNSPNDHLHFVLDDSVIRLKLRVLLVGILLIPAFFRPAYADFGWSDSQDFFVDLLFSVRSVGWEESPTFNLDIRNVHRGWADSPDFWISLIDLIAPVISADTPTGTPGSNGWWCSDVTVPFSATDNLSGFAPEGALSINLASKTTSGEGAGLTVTSDGISDMAGNAAAGIQAGPFKVDWTPPTLIWSVIDPAPNAAGWNNSVPVKIPFMTDDNLSGVATGIPPSPLSFNAEGQNQTQDVTVTDVASNSDTFTSPAVNIDKTPPVVTITLPVPITVLLNQPGVNLVADWSATDNLSGVVPPTNGTTTQSLNTGIVGTRTADVTAPQGTAVDNAGNQSAAVTVVYTYYVRYDFGGTLPPINPDGSSVFKLKSTILVKFQLRDAEGNFVSSALAKIYVAKITDSVIGTDEEAVSTIEATTGNLFRYDSTSNQYLFNLGTKTLSTGGWQIRIELDDGTSKYVLVSLK